MNLIENLCVDFSFVFRFLNNRLDLALYVVLRRTGVAGPSLKLIVGLGLISRRDSAISRLSSEHLIHIRYESYSSSWTHG